MAGIDTLEDLDAALETTAEWSAALDRVCADPSLIQPHFQPIVDLGKGVVAGYELLARFRHPMGHSPAEWFDAAGRLGYIEVLDALMLLCAREALPRLLANQFLTVNLTPRGAVSAQVAEAMGEGRSLEALVVELTEQTAIVDPALLAVSAAKMRSHGALVAVDDAGSGYASLERMLSLRPEFVKIDRSFVAEIHTDEAKAAATEMIGTFASRINAWVIAEGVEHTPELDRLVQMGVPLAQGYLFARPAPGLEQVEDRWAKRQPRAAGQHPDAVGGLMETADEVRADAHENEIASRFEDAAIDFVPVVDERGRPTGLLRRDDRPGPGRWIEIAEPLLIEPQGIQAQVLKRAMTRPREQRLNPLVCCNEQGQYLGLIRVERLIEALTES